MFVLDTYKKETKNTVQKEEQKQEEKIENKKKDIIVNFN